MRHHHRRVRGAALATAALGAFLPIGFVAASLLPATTASSAGATEVTTDSCGYASTQIPNFNEDTITQWAQVNAPTGGNLLGSVSVYSDDEKAMLLGVNGATALGTTTAGTPYNDVTNPALGAASLDDFGRPQAPSLYFSDITTNASNTAGDWQAGTSTAVTLTTVYHSTSATLTSGSLTAANVGNTVSSDTSSALPAGDAITAVSGTSVTFALAANSSASADVVTLHSHNTPANLIGNTPSADFVGGAWATATLTGGTYSATVPVHSNVTGSGASTVYNLGPGSIAPTGFTTLLNEAFAAEVRWNLSDFSSLVPGHTYRVQALTHDGDENRTGGDVGEYCTTFRVPVPANLSVTKVDVTPGNGASVALGGQIVYDLNVTNSGERATANNTVVSDAIPAGSTYVASSASCGSFASGVCSTSTTGSPVTSVSFTFPNGVPAGTSGVSLSLKVTANAGDTNGQVISDAATYTDVANSCGSAATCPTNTVTNHVLTPANLTALKVDASPGNGADVALGGTITYNLTVTNTGGTATGAATVSDPIPSGSTYVADSASCGTMANCTVDTSGSPVSSVTYTFAGSTGVAALTSGTLSFQVSATSTDTNGQVISNTAAYTNVNSGCGSGATCSTNTVTNTVVTPTNLTVVKVDATPGNGATVRRGAQIRYDFNVSNAGGTATGLAGIIDTIPANATYVAGSASCGTMSNCTVTTSGSPVSAVTFTFAGPVGVAALTSGTVTFVVAAKSSAANNASIPNTARYTNVNGACGTGSTCITDTVLNKVVVPVVAAKHVVKQAPPAKVTPVVAATTVHTGEPWAGSGPVAAAVAAAGVLLLGLGELLRRRRNA